ncbi:MAG: hypothetical protein A2X32_04230 [Elusimicrobia bacterium GWC2_64_44]|nr:MAG: hypothetical protein A2X32_04230 [Elusimicrobia bacterium GWC2_64_44]
MKDKIYLLIGVAILPIIVWFFLFRQPSGKPVTRFMQPPRREITKEQIDTSKPEAALMRIQQLSPPDTREICGKIIAMYPGTDYVPQAMYETGVAYYRECDYRNAVSQFEGVVSSFPASRYGRGFADYALRSVFLHRIGNWPGCPIEKLREFISENPHHKMLPDAQYALAYYYHTHTGNNPFQSASDEFQVLISSFPGSKYGKDARRYIDWVARITAQEEKLGNSGDDAKAENLFALGKLYYDFLSDFAIEGEVSIWREPAYKIFRKVVLDYPKSSYAAEADYLLIWHLPGIYFEGGDTDRAVDLSDTYQKYVDKYPNSQHAPEILCESADFLRKLVPDLMNVPEEENAVAWIYARLPSSPDDFIAGIISRYSAVVQNYPASEYAKKAEDSISQLKEFLKRVDDYSKALATVHPPCIVGRCPGGSAACCGPYTLVGPNAQKCMALEKKELVLSGVALEAKEINDKLLYVTEISSK